MKNYYEDLEVSKNASKEVIEKAYKVLAKKYHPDMNRDSDKLESEEKFKKISEAYEVLSNNEKRENYDIEFEQNNPTISYEEYLKLLNENKSLNSKLSKIQNQFYNSSISNINQSTDNYYKNNILNNSRQDNANYNIEQTRSNIPNTNSENRTHRYYYTNTGKPASAFAYFKYKIKEIFTNIILLLLSVLVALLIFNAFLPINIFDFLIK